MADEGEAVTSADDAGATTTDGADASTLAAEDLEAPETTDAAESGEDAPEGSPSEDPHAAEEGESQMAISERTSQSAGGEESAMEEGTKEEEEEEGEGEEETEGVEGQTGGTRAATTEGSGEEPEMSMAQRLMMDLDDEDLVPGSSEDEGESEFQDEESGEEEEVEDEGVTRDDLIGEYHAMLEERESLQQRRHFLENKLAEYFRKKRDDKAEADKKPQTAEQEQRYVKYMSQLEDLKNEEISEQEIFQRELQELRVLCQRFDQEVVDELESFRLYKRNVALGAINSRTGKPLTVKDIDVYEARETQKTAEVVAVRLENIKLKNRLKKREQQLKAKEELAEGLHLIDFEQLKIENQTYNEKIEERNEELLKLRKKITSTVQVLTHLKEKLQFVQAENQVQKVNLKTLESTVASRRDVLSKTKQGRDALRIDNQRLRLNCGMLGNEPLLRDFEEKKNEAEMLEQKLERLKRQHAELTLSCSGVRKKIEQVRAIRS